MNFLLDSLLESFMVTALIYLFCFEKHIAKWEQEQWARFRRFIRKMLRKSKRIVAWAESDNSKAFDNMCLADPEIWSDWYTA